MGYKTARALAWMLLIAIIIAASVIAAKAQVKGTARDAAAQAQLATRALIAKQCDRNQVVRAWQRVRAREAPARHNQSLFIRDSDRYFTTVNCDATYALANHGRRTVYLSHGLDECFVRLTRDGYWTDSIGSRTPPVTDPEQLRHICATR